MTTTYVPPADLVVKTPPKPRKLGVCGLQFAAWGQRQFYRHLAAHRYRGQQIFTAAELALAPNHFDYAALTDPDRRQRALDYLQDTMSTTGHEASEVSGHAAIMGLLCPTGVIHSGFKDFLPPGVWVTRPDGEPDVAEIRKRTIVEADKIFTACVYAGVPRFNLFTGSGRVGKEAVQFPHLPDQERADIIGRDEETLGIVGRIARQAGMEELNIEHHPEQLFHTPEEIVEFALRFHRNPELRIFACKSDVSHLFFTGLNPPEVIRMVTAELKHALELEFAEKIAFAKGMDDQRGDDKPTEEEKVRAEIAKAAQKLVFFRRMHAKYGLFRISGRQSTHSRSNLANPSGVRPNRFGPVDFGSPEMWGEIMYALNEHGMSMDAAVMLEHEDDATVALTPGTTDVRQNVLYRVGEFAFDYLCMASPTVSHQEAMVGKA